MRSWVLSALMVSAALAGCLGDESAPEPASQAGDDEPVDPDRWHELALGDGHDHADRELHANLTTANFETIGHDALETREGTSPGGSSCADTAPADDGTVIGAQKAGNSRGVAIAEVAPNGTPRMLGELWLTFTHIYDVAAVPGGEHLALITSEAKQGPAPSPGVAGDQSLGYLDLGCGSDPVPITQQTQDPVPRPSSLLLVSIANPDEPEIVDHRPITGLGHSVYADTIDGETWLVGTTENLLQGGRHYYFNHVTDGPNGGLIEPVSTHVAQPKPDHADYLGGHTDAWLQKHPETGDLLAYLSAGPAIEIVDLSTPEAPTTLATWTDIGPEDPGNHNLHSVHPLEATVNGSHYTVVGPELGSAPSDKPTGVVWVLDTTDPAKPEAVAAWTLPAEVTWEGRLQFSPHYMDVWNDTLFVSMYHGGVWGIDLAEIDEGSPDDVHALDSLGAYVPAQPAPLPDPSYSYSWTPNLEDVEVIDEANGTLATFEGNTGIYTFTFDRQTPVPLPNPWPLDPASELPDNPKSR